MPFIKNRFICWVLPGRELARAMLLFVSALIRLDLPTLDLPIKAILGMSLERKGLSSSLVSVAMPAINSQVRIFIGC